MTTWLIRKTGSDTNGGTSQSVLATATDGVTNASTNTLTSVTAPFTAGMVGQGIYISQGSSYRTITAFNSSSSITYSGANLGAHTGITYRVGGSWLTLGNALVSGAQAIIAAGDSIYVGAGTYAQTLAVTISGSSGNPISVIGDVDGAQTSDAGQVIISAYTSGNTSVPSSTVLLALGTHTYLSFSLITFIGGSAAMITCTAGGAIGCSWTDCTFNALFLGSANGIMRLTSPTTGVAWSITVDRCLLVGMSVGVLFTLSETASGAADWDALCVVRNSMFVTAGGAIQVTSTASSTYKGGGVRAYGCSVVSAGACFQTLSNVSTTVPCEVHNSLLGSLSATGIAAGTAGQITGSYNSIYAATPESNYTYGTGDVSNSAGTGTYLAPLLELGQSFKWAGVLRQFMAPDGATSPLLGAGSSTFTGNYPTVDWANRPRPSGGGSANAAIGYAELHDFATQNKSTYPSGYTSSASLLGPGDADIWIPVDAVSTVITLQVYQGSGYSGTNYATATLLAAGELGVISQTETCSSSLSTWQTLTFSAIVPSKPGWVKVRVTSFDTSGTGYTLFGAVT